MRLTLLLTCLAALASASCATSDMQVAPTDRPVAGSRTTEPLKLREPILGVMVGIMDFSSWGVFRISTLRRDPTDSEWLAAGLASLNLIGASTLITIPGTGDHDAVWTKEDSWRGYAEEMQLASMAVSFAVRDRKASALSTAANRLAEACQACHAKYRPELPPISATRLASLTVTADPRPDH